MQDQPTAHLIVYDRESHLFVPEGDTLALGDTFEVYRGNGPREGERMGTATVTRFEDGSPVLDVRFESYRVNEATGEAD